MTKEQQDKIWSLLSDEEKGDYIKKYQDNIRNSKDRLMGDSCDVSIAHSRAIIDSLLNIFGEHNLNSIPKSDK